MLTVLSWNLGLNKVTYNEIIMKRIFAVALLAFSIVGITSCGEKIQEEQKVDFGDVGPHIQLDYVDGEFVPKTEPIGQDIFDALFQGTWTLEQIKHVSRTGKLTDVEKLIGIPYPCFGIKEGGKLRQYISSPATHENTYKDGSYLYNPQNGILNFFDVVEEHPEFRVVTLKESEMTGTFKGEDNDYDQAVLTLYVYRRLSPLDGAGLDQLHGAE